MGKVKLTLSVNEEAVAQARYYAKKHGRTLSSLFEEKAAELETANQLSTDQVLEDCPELRRLVGAFKPSEPFDARSAYYRKKHG
jgi:hypothetical protein